MKKRYIIVSDLHLGRGRIYRGVQNYKEDFLYDEDFYDFLRYWVQESEGFELKLVLNGDIVDIVKSAYKDKEVYKKEVFSFIDDCVEGHRVFFSALKDFQSEGGNIFYVIGNHDQAVASPEVQAFLVEKTGLNIKFVKRELIEDGIWIEHGHKYEVINRTDLVDIWIRDDKGEEKLNIPWGSRFVVEVAGSFSVERPYVERWRPLRQALKWGLIFETKLTLKFLIRIIKFVLKNRRIYDPASRRYYRTPWREVMEAMGHKIVDRSATTVLKRPDINVVIMGHTHRALRKDLNGKLYINTGTWIPFVSFYAPHIGLIEKKTFVLIEKSHSIFAGVFEWNGVRKLYSEFRSVLD